MKGQLSLFQEEKKSSGKAKKKREKSADPSQSFDERMKRFFHYMDMKGMNEQWIDTSAGEVRIIIEALADYYDIANRHVEEMELGYKKAAWQQHLERIKQIQTKLEESIGYSRDKQIEICMKRRSSKKDDIGEDALVLALRKGNPSTAS